MNLKKYIQGDRVIWVVLILLSVVSTLVVYSSIVTLAYKNKAGDTTYYLFRHLIFISFGFLMVYFTHRIKYTYYSRLSQIAIYLAVPLLIFTLIGGANLNQASRWIEVPGIGLTFQTSDFAKLALIAYLARVLSIKQGKIKSFKSAFLPIIFPVIIICGLILPANFSTAAVLFTTCLVLMFIGRISFKYIMMLVGTSLALFSIFIAIALNMPESVQKKMRVETWKARIENYTSGESKGNYQAEQSKIAIATGGAIGKGAGKSTQRNFLPHPYSDFIFAIIIEEYGLLGSIIIAFLYTILFFRSAKIAGNSRKTFGSLLAIGCCFSLVFQAMINMAVAVNLFPVTGQPLPLVSMGGTSLLFTCIAIGIILSVSREAEEKGNFMKGGKLATA